METRNNFKKEKEQIKIKEEISYEYDDSPSEANNSNNEIHINVKEEVMKKEITGDEQFIEISTNSVSKMELAINEKSKALTKDETRGLLELILSHPIITSKETNATNNQQKIIEWNQITEDFNNTFSVFPRTSKQLRLKWENMKKNARRRNAKIRMNRGKTDLTAEYIPRNQILDKVYTLLRKRSSAVTPKPKRSEGDSEDSDDDAPLVCERDERCLREAASEDVVAPNPSAVPENVMRNAKNGFSELPPRKKKFRSDDGREARNRAIAGYYSAKTKLIDANLINIRLQNEKLRLEIEALKKNTK